MYDDYINRFKRKTEVEKKATSQIGDIIAQSLSKMDVLVNSSTLAIPVAFINKDKEAFSEAVMYTYIDDGVVIGDMINVFDRIYLVYKELKNIKRDGYINKFNLIECNIKFTLNNSEVRAAFKGPLRSKYSEEENLSDNFGVTSSSEAIIIFPNVGPNALNMKQNDYFTVDDQSWRIITIDKITNPGITYAAVEEYFAPDLEKISFNENALPLEEPPTNENILIAGITHNFATEMGYFKADKNINIVERTTSSVRFIIPFNIDEINIEVKRDGQIVSEYYLVRT